MNEYNLFILIALLFTGSVANLKSQNTGIVLGSRGCINDYLYRDNSNFGDKTDSDLSWSGPMYSTKLPVDYFRVTCTSPNTIPGTARCPANNSGDITPTINTANNGRNKVSDYVGPSFDSRNNKDLFYSETDNYMLSPVYDTDGGLSGDNSIPQDENLINSGSPRFEYGTYNAMTGTDVPGHPLDTNGQSYNSAQFQVSSDFTGPVFGNYAPNYEMGDNSYNNENNSNTINSNTLNSQDFKGPVFNNYNNNNDDGEIPCINLSDSPDTSADGYGDSNLESFKLNQQIASYFHGPIFDSQGQPADGAFSGTSDSRNVEANFDDSFSHESGNGLGITSFVGPVFSNYADNGNSSPGQFSQAPLQYSSNIQNQNIPASASQTQNAQNNPSPPYIDASNGNSANNNQSSDNAQSQTPSSSDTNNNPSNSNSQPQNSAVIANGDSTSTTGVISPVVSPNQNPGTPDADASNASNSSNITETSSTNSSLNTSNGNTNQSQESQNNSNTIVNPLDNNASNNPQSQTNNGSGNNNDQTKTSNTSNQIPSALPITSTNQSQTSQNQNNPSNPINSITDSSLANQSPAVNIGLTPQGQTSTASSNMSQTNVVKKQNNSNVVTQTTPNSSYDNTYSQDNNGLSTLNNSYQISSVSNDQSQFPITPPNSPSNSNLNSSTTQSISTPALIADSSNSQTNPTNDSSNGEPSQSSNSDQYNYASSTPSSSNPDQNQNVNISTAKVVSPSVNNYVSTSVSSSNASSGSSGNNGTPYNNSSTSISSTSSNSSNSGTSTTSDSSSASTNPNSTSDTKFLSTHELPLKSVSPPPTKSFGTTIKANINLYLLAILFISLL